MAVPAVKILFSSSHHALDEQLQEWLQLVSGQVTIAGISLDSNDYGHSLALLHTDDPGPEYHGRVWFAFDHSALEAEVNDALRGEETGPQALVALGANKHGHCLCLIATVR